MPGWHLKGFFVIIKPIERFCAYFGPWYFVLCGPFFYIRFWLCLAFLGQKSKEKKTGKIEREKSIFFFAPESKAFFFFAYKNRIYRRIDVTKAYFF